MGGVEALQRRRTSGRPPKLTPQQFRQLPDLLAPGAEAYGFHGQVWTTKRVSHLIGRQFGVQYHPAHMSRLLRAVGWSVQQPIQRATQRNEAAIKAFLARGAAKRLHLEQFPGYAPELNPDEGIWNYLKRVELKNVCCRDLAQLVRELRQAKERVRHKREVIRGCIRECGYEVEPVIA